MISTGKGGALLLAVVFIAMLAVFFPLTADLISIAASTGYPYTGPDIHADYFVGALLGLFFGFLVLIAPIQESLRGTALFCWAAKVAVALFVMPVYEYAYRLDNDYYFMISDFPEQPSIVNMRGTWYVQVLAWLLFQVIGPSFHGGKIAFSFLGFIGIFLTYRGAARFLKQEHPVLLLLTMLAPTGIFWSALLGKDPVSLFATGLYAYGTFSWLREFQLRHAFMILVAAAIAGSIRGYFLPIMGLPLTIAFLFQTRRPIIRLIMFPAILFGILFSIGQFGARMKLDSFESFVTYQSKVASSWKGGSSFSLPSITSPLMLLIVAPLAVMTALFRPTLLEAHNPFSFAAALDNTVLFILLLYAVKRSRIRELLQPEVIWMSSFVLIWSVMYGIGTGNMGALSRFKIQVLPIFITLLLYMARKRFIAKAAKA